MKSVLLAMTFILCSLATFAQGSEDPSSYENSCIGLPGAGDYISIDVYYNDPDDDCVSNDWLAFYWRVDGTLWINTSWNPLGPGCDGRTQNPNCWDIMNFNEFLCCLPEDDQGNNDGGGGGSGGGGTGGGVNTSTSCLTEGCGVCFSPNQFRDCIIDCSSCRGL